MILYQLLRELLRMGRAQLDIASYWTQRRHDEATGTYTETIEATGTPAAGQSSSDGGLLSLRLHQHAYSNRRLQQTSLLAN